MVAPGLSVYPVSDTRFRLAVEVSYSRTDDRGSLGEARLAAVAALLRPSYPLATVQLGETVRPQDAELAWDAFRDGIVLDDELLRRARAGMSDAIGQLYDRHHHLAFAVALRTAGDEKRAADAVMEAFCTLLASEEGHLTVRVLVARAARDAVLADGAPPPSALQHRDPFTDAQRIVLDLARTHRLLGTDIATVLRLDIRDVRRHATEGLAALAVSRGARPRRPSEQTAD